MSWDIDHFRFCAYCPNPCRSAIGDDRKGYRESQTPSALSLVAVLVADGFLDWDAHVKQGLTDTSIARKCRPACPYDYDIADEIDTFVRERGETP